MASKQELSRLVRAAAEDADLMPFARDDELSMLSPAEISVLHWLIRFGWRRKGAVAELGAYLGGTTTVLGEALRRSGATEPVLEVYDFFQHNPASRKRLAGNPLVDDDGFFRLWEHNTERYRDLISLHAGDLRETATANSGPLEMLYVDVVKADILINPMMSFLPRLRPGGFLVHQDYFHFQSPWVVYATEHLIDFFEVLGPVSNQMLVLRLRPDVQIREQDLIDYLSDLTVEAKLELMDRAIGRQSGLRAGLLEISKLNLALEATGYDVDGEVARLQASYGHAPRLARYLRAVQKLHADAAAGAARAIW